MRRLVIGLALLVVGWIIGFIPQYMKARHFELQAGVCDTRLQLAEIRRLSALTYVSATQLNYGTAADYAKQMFTQAQNLAGNTSDPSTRNLATNLLSARDKVTADLSKADAQVVSELQPIVLEVQGAANK